MKSNLESKSSILHLNAYDTHGGAERLAGELMRAQREAGHKVEMLVGNKCDPSSPALAFDPDPDRAQFQRLRAAGLPDYELRGSHRLVDHPFVKACQVIHIHNLYGGYFNPFSLIALSQFRPVVWSMHDMQAITGYCSHALDCPKWKNGCGDCPDLTRPGPYLPVDSTARLWSDKQAIYRNSRLWIVGPSQWIVDQLQQSILAIHPIRKILNGINTQIFSPRNRVEVRAKLHLPEQAPVVGGLARGGALAHPWKGGRHAMDALAILRQRFPHLIYLDLGGEGVPKADWIRNVATDSQDEMAEFLSAVDVLLYPSTADTAPLAVMEALSCGVPVVAFRVGGIPDQIRHGETGFLCEPASSEALADAVARLLGDSLLRHNFSAAARQDALCRFDISLSSEAFLKLYQESIAEFSGDGALLDSPFREETSGDLVLLQNSVLNTKKKLKELRVKKNRESERTQALLKQPWVKAGMRLGFLPKEIRKWAAKILNDTD